MNPQKGGSAMPAPSSIAWNPRQWWVNIPIGKICASQKWVHLPRVGVKIYNHLSGHHHLLPISKGTFLTFRWICLFLWRGELLVLRGNKIGGLFPPKKDPNNLTTSPPHLDVPGKLVNG